MSISETAMVGQLAIVLCVAGLQLSLALAPAGWVRRATLNLRRLVTGLAAVQALAAVTCLGLLAVGMRANQLPLNVSNCLSFQYTPTTGLMFVLISFIGWITCRYSIRYLDGESCQGRYFQWMSFTIGAVGLMVLSGDLLTFAIFWTLTSFGLHHLLLHYQDRPAAQRAAWTKFIISRLGDMAILIAICLYYPVVSSLQFSDLARAAVDASIASLPAFQWATVALAIGVVIKSAQIPFHTWLPLTMETPTPVSALMHAGIVNAGGFLLVRSGPLVGASPVAQTVLVAVGTMTACLASVIMLTQTSIKKKLAYSTIAQMGFMLMQCGLAAYSAAMLHILAHSLYKAHEFLSSGSVIARRSAVQTLPIQTRTVRWPAILATLLGLTAVAWFLLVLVGQDPLNKSGGTVLICILCASLTTWLMNLLSVARWPLILRAVATAAALIGFYAICFALIDSVVLASMPREHKLHGPAWPISVLVLLPFLGLFVLQLALMSPQALYRLRYWQIHATNGFYIESWMRRRFQLLNS